MFSFFKKKEKNNNEKQEELQVLSSNNEKNKEEIEVEKEIEQNISHANIKETKEDLITDDKTVNGTIKSTKERDEKEIQKNFFSRALEKTVSNFSSIIPKKKEIIFFNEIEDVLIEADMEYEVIEQVMEGFENFISRKQLREKLIPLFADMPKIEEENLPKPFVQLIIGVNGAGKTTTIAKLANRYKSMNKKVLLGAGDTFRAAAIEQLSTWATKLDIAIIKTKQGHDSSAVAYDTISSGIAKDFDNVIIDTAGRLQTQTNLSNELKKIVKVCSKAQENAPHQKLMILDGTQGNSAIAQAKAFHEMIGIDGIIVTKLDGTAKGGALFSIASQLKIPILYVGIGEKATDLIEFSADAFVDSLLDGIFTKDLEDKN